MCLVRLLHGVSVVSVVATLSVSAPPLQSHWPFSVHFSEMANQNNIKQDTFKYAKLMANQIHNYNYVDMTKWPTISDTFIYNYCTVI